MQRLWNLVMEVAVVLLMPGFPSRVVPVHSSGVVVMQRLWNLVMEVAVVLVMPGFPRRRRRRRRGAGVCVLRLSRRCKSSGRACAANGRERCACCACRPSACLRLCARALPGLQDTVDAAAPRVRESFVEARHPRLDILPLVGPVFALSRRRGALRRRVSLLRGDRRELLAQGARRVRPRPSCGVLEPSQRRVRPRIAGHRPRQGPHSGPTKRRGARRVRARRRARGVGRGHGRGGARVARDEAQSESKGVKLKRAAPPPPGTPPGGGPPIP